jgi:Skp family chaperone for outer membrane proteins
MHRNLTAALVALVAGSALATSVLSEGTPAPMRLGFIDIRKAFETYRKRTEVMQQLKKKSEDYDAALKQRWQQIEQEQDKIATMNSGTDEYIDLARRIKGEKAMFDVDKEFKQRMLEAEQRKKNALVYKEISQEAAAYGLEQGLAAVLMYLPAETDFEQDLDMVVPTRAVLCRDDQLDVTKAVVERLNAQLPPPK